jgi:hypothetical protein
MEIDEALVDTHLVAIVGIRPLTARRFARCDAQGFGGQAHGALDLESLVLSATHQVGAHCGPPEEQLLSTAHAGQARANIHWTHPSPGP